MESELADGAKPVSNGGQRNVADTDGVRRPTTTERRPDATIENGRFALDEYIKQGGFIAAGCGRGISEQGQGAQSEYQVGERWAQFPSVSPVHRGNDGLPFDVDRLTLSFGKWRTEALKAYGNAIVPQVMYEIFRAIEQVENP